MPVHVTLASSSTKVTKNVADFRHHFPIDFRLKVKIMDKKYKPDFLSNAMILEKNKLGLNSRSDNIPTLSFLLKSVDHHVERNFHFA